MSIELVATGEVKVTDWPPVRVTASRPTADWVSWPMSQSGPTTLPVFGEFWASTSTYGRLAPLPPVTVAAEAVCTAKARTPPVSSAVLPTKATPRLSSRMEWNTLLLSLRQRRTRPAPPRSDGMEERQCGGAGADGAVVGWCRGLVRG